jgi:hypothetical protein
VSAEVSCRSPVLGAATTAAQDSEGGERFYIAATAEAKEMVALSLFPCAVQQILEVLSLAEPVEESSNFEEKPETELPRESTGMLVLLRAYVELDLHGTHQGVRLALYSQQQLPDSVILDNSGSEPAASLLATVESGIISFDVTNAYVV